jgi:hypothetical protein
MKAKSEIMLMVTSAMGTSQNPPRKEMGIPMVVQNASRVLRKSVRHAKTRMRPMLAFLSRRPMRCLSENLQVLLGDLCHLEGALAPHPVDLDQGRPLAVEIGRGVGFFKPVDHGRHIRQTNPGPIRPRHHDDVLEFDSTIELTLGAQQDLATPGFDRTAREVERRRSNRIGHVLEAQAITAKGLL